MPVRVSSKQMSGSRSNAASTSTTTRRVVSSSSYSTSSTNNSMSSSLPSHTNQIMDAFLINNKSQTSSRYEQRKHAEQQKAILSSLKRPQSTANNQKEIQSFWPANINDTNRDNTTRINSSLDSDQQHATNQYNPRQSQIQLSTSGQNTTTGIQQHRAIQQEEIQPLVQSRQSSPQLRQNSPKMQSSTSGRSPPHQSATPKRKATYQPLYTQTTIDEEDDIVCCDCASTDGHWREGTKNICTISLWALIAFAILNRLFVHMNLSMHHKVTSNAQGSVSPKDVGVVIPNDVNAVVPETAQIVFDKQEIAETTQSETRVIDGMEDTDPNNRVIDGQGDTDSNSILSNQIPPIDANVEVALERPIDDGKRMVETTQSLIDGKEEKQDSSGAISNHQRPKLRIWDR